MKFVKYIIICLLSMSCKAQSTIIKVENTLPFQRNNDVITLTKTFLDTEEALENLKVEDEKTGQKQVTQLIDLDGNGINDELIFQPKIEANSTKTYKVYASNKNIEETLVCYSRFVPERTDDYAWENDKVAFRVYGPTAQKMVKAKQKGGTLSSGVDAWLKRVEHPIINKWYANNVNGKSYHKDYGEGQDNFHVGKSAGVGGFMIKKGNKYYTSKNFNKYRTITTGPIRTSFYLEYENWDANGAQIKESKVITLDKGNQLSKFELSISGTEEISIGLTLHNKKGTISEKDNYVSYWKKHVDSELGLGVIVPENQFISSEKYIVDKKDRSHVFANAKVENEQVVYYAGFAWKKAGEITSNEAWNNYLNKFNQRIVHPLKLTKK